MHSGFISASLSLEGVVLASAIVWLVYALGLAIYNLYFHPLAKFPGPASRAAFHIPYFWALWHGETHEELRRLHDKYGEIVRERPDSLSFSSAQAWKDIYGSRPGKGQLPKDPLFYSITGDKAQSIIYCTDADHSRMRKLLSHAFSDAALREQEDILTQYFDLLVAGLTRACSTGTPVDLTLWYNYLSFDVVSDLCFGESFHALEKGEHHSWVRVIFESIKYSRILPIAIFYPPGIKLLQLLLAVSPGIRRAQAEHQSFTNLRTSQRLEMKTERKDFINYILRYNDERGMSRDEIIATSAILLIAGSETTATLLSGATYFLLSNPALYARARDEVRGAFRTAADMTVASTAKLPYLQAVLEEALRMYPPVPLAMPRRTTPTGAWIADKWVPGNISVAISQWAVNRSPRHWADPDTFAPERWLEPTPPRYKDDNRAIRSPFSFGPRNCIGKNLAYNEMRSVLARVLWHFDLELCDDSRRWTEQKVFFLWEKPPLNVRMTVRKDRA